MLERVSSLALILERMHVLYGRALDLLRRERETLIILDFEGFVNLLKEKDEVLAALRALDKDRLRIQDQFAVLWDMDPVDLSLKTLGEELLDMGPDFKIQGERLLALRGNLQNVLDELKRRISNNENFIEKSIDSLRNLAEHLSAKLTGKPGPDSRKTGVYTDKARYQGTQEHKGNLIRKRL